MYYTTADRLVKVFGKYFSQTDDNKRDPDDYLKNSSKVANYVYCCRMGNGTEASGDGYKYRGRGIFQLTGKDNYTAFSNFYKTNYNSATDILSNPGLVASNETIAVISALWFYQNNVLDKITIDSNTTVEKVTTKVNGKTNGIKDRKTKFESTKSNIDCI